MTTSADLTACTTASTGRLSRGLSSRPRSSSQEFSLGPSQPPSSAPILSSSSPSSFPLIQLRRRFTSLTEAAIAMVPQVAEKEATPSTSTEDSLQLVTVTDGASSERSGRDTEDDSQSDSFAGPALNGTLPLLSNSGSGHKGLVAYVYDADSMKLEALELEERELSSAKPLLRRPATLPLNNGLSGSTLTCQGMDESARSTSEDIPVVGNVDPPESLWAITFQVFIPFLIAGFGTVGAGLVLDMVQHWKVFEEVTEVFILVPALLGLKGNLEMTLASRLSTQANLGHMDTTSEQIKLTTGNMALIQCQATVLGFIASLIAVIMGWIPQGQFNVSHALVLCASAIFTASIASLILGCIMVGVVIASRKLHINPDNVATPIAASLGDLTTLALLAGISSFLYYRVEKYRWLAPLVIAVFLLLIPVWALIARRNKYTREILSSGWSPIIAAVGISSGGGIVLDFAVSKFKGIAVFQPVINGVGGNLVAVQASRISTFLHQHSRLGFLPPTDSKICVNPFVAFCSNNPHARTARVLLMMVIPGHIVFAYGIRLLKAGHTSLTVVFLVVYLLSAFVQVFLLLFIAHIMVHWMWSRKTDPDNSAIPYLTAIGDLLGTSFLAVAFLFLYSIGDRDADVGD